MNCLMKPQTIVHISNHGAGITFIALSAVAGVAQAKSVWGY